MGLTSIEVRPRSASFISSNPSLEPFTCEPASLELCAFWIPDNGIIDTNRSMNGAGNNTSTVRLLYETIFAYRQYNIGNTIYYLLIGNTIYYQLESVWCTSVLEYLLQCIYSCITSWNVLVYTWICSVYDWIGVFVATNTKVISSYCLSLYYQLELSWIYGCVSVFLVVVSVT